MLLPSVLWCCWLGGRKGIRPVKNMSGGALVCLSVWSKVQTCIWPSWCLCHSLSLASVKSRLVLSFWYQFTWVVPAKGPLNGCVCVCVSFFIPVRSFFINFCSFVVFLAFDLHLHFAYAVLSIICYFVTVDLSRGNVLSSELQSPISTQSVYALSVSGWKKSVTTVVWNWVSWIPLGPFLPFFSRREPLEWVFYRPDVFPVSQPFTSKHWRKREPVSGLASSFLYPLENGPW